MRRLLSALFVVSCLAAACSVPLTEDPAALTTTSTTEPESSSTTEPPLPPAQTIPIDPEDAEALAQLPGRLLIGVGPFVGVTNPDGSGAALLGGDPLTPAIQPTWSNEGALIAWSRTGRQDAAIVVFDPATGSDVETPIDGAAPFYLQWNHVDQALAFLRNAPSGDELEAGIARIGEPVEILDRGAPYFFEWAPDQDVWLANDGDELKFVDEQGVFPIDTPTRRFTVPRWRDTDLVVVGTPDGLAVVDFLFDEGTVVPLRPGPLLFTVSPDGARAAFAPPTNGQDATGLVVVDLDLGTQEVVTTDEVAWWEWSPSGEFLVWSGLDRADAADLAQLHFWNAESRTEVSVAPSYRPSEVMLRDYLPFFTQYAASHTGWAPDDSAYAFAGSIGGESGIWVHVLDGPDAVRVQVGDVVFWSPDLENIETGRSPV